MSTYRSIENNGTTKHADAAYLPGSVTTAVSTVESDTNQSLPHVVFAEVEPATKPVFIGPALSPVSQRRVPEDADLGWAAGVMDGEGCIHIACQTWGNTGRRPNYRMRLEITQNDLMLLREFEWCVGVTGRLYSPKPTKKQNRTCHSLVYDGVRAYEVLERLIRFLRRKKQQAKLAADFRTQCEVHKHTGPRGWPEAMWELRRWYYERMSDLKRA